jgi:hypothetical protein
MNTEAVRTEIKSIISALHKQLGKFARKQYPVAKWQVERLTALGIIDLMPSGYGHSDAAQIIKAAEDAARRIWDGGDEFGDYENYPGSSLWQLLNQPVASEPTPEAVAELPGADAAPFPAAHQAHSEFWPYGGHRFDASWVAQSRAARERREREANERRWPVLRLARELAEATGADQETHTRYQVAVALLDDARHGGLSPEGRQAYLQVSDALKTTPADLTELRALVVRIADEAGV